jgi:hypothetical protein
MNGDVREFAFFQMVIPIVSGDRMPGIEKDQIKEYSFTGGHMKKVMLLALVVMLLLTTPVFAGAKERSGLVLVFDAGVPIKGAEGRYGADFGRSFLDLALQARLAGNFFVECAFSFYPVPRPGDEFLYDNDGFELALDALWKSAHGKKINPFVKIGLSYAWITANNAYMEIYYPGAGRQKDHWLGLNAAGGIEYRLNKKLLLRLGGAFTLVPNDGESAVASWGKLFAGLGLRI